MGRRSATSCCGSTSSAERVHRGRPGADGIARTGGDAQAGPARRGGRCRPRPGGYVLAAGPGLPARRRGRAVRELAQPEAGRGDVRMNDGACDPQGRFWAGTMAYDESPGAGALYRLELDGSCTTGTDRPDHLQRDRLESRRRHHVPRRQRHRPDRRLRLRRRRRRPSRRRRTIIADRRARSGAGRPDRRRRRRDLGRTVGRRRAFAATHPTARCSSPCRSRSTGRRRAPSAAPSRRRCSSPPPGRGSTVPRWPAARRRAAVRRRGLGVTGPPCAPYAGRMPPP